MCSLKKIAIILLALFITINLASLLMMENGAIDHGSCSFANGQSLCPMTIADHLNSWQNSFLATAVDSLTLLLVLAISLIAFVVFKLSQSEIRFFQQFFDTGQIADVFLFKELKFALAKGIVNPKTF